MPDEQHPDAPRYLIEFTEPALVEADAAYLRISEQVGLEYAIRWYEGLFVAAEALSSLPRIHSIAPENDFSTLAPPRGAVISPIASCFTLLSRLKTNPKVLFVSYTSGMGQKIICLNR